MTPTTRQTSDAETRDRILDAARGAFQERGTAGARMQEIADAAGVNKALLHYYFRNKETLAAAVFQGELRSLVQPVMETLAGDQPLADKVRRVVELYLDKLTRVPALPGYVLSELNFHPDRIQDLMGSVMAEAPEEVAQSVLGSLRWQLAAESARGTMRPMAPEEFVVNLVSLCVFPFAARPLLEFLVLKPGEFERFIEDRKRLLPEFFLKGLAP